MHYLCQLAKKKMITTKNNSFISSPKGAFLELSDVDFMTEYMKYLNIKHTVAKWLRDITVN